MSAMSAAMTQAAIPQFRYHEWPNGKAPALQFTAKLPSTPGIARQLSPWYDLPSPNPTSLSIPFVKHCPGTAPLPFVWDPVNRDYFCYEPETTCYVYAKLGRIHYDSVKREHFRPDGVQRLTFASTYPEHRVYQTGEILFWDSRRKDWYQYDMQTRRILWRDHRWWPFPPKFEPPSLNSPPRSPTRSAPASNVQHSHSSLYHTLPYKMRTERAKTEEPRIIEVTPFDASTVISDSSHQTLPTVIERHTHVHPKLDRLHPKHDHLHVGHKHKHKHMETETVVITEEKDDDIIYEIPLHSHHRGRKKHRRHRGEIYDLQDLVDKTMRKKRRYSFF
ncbi:hypothetical protein CBER1_02742 [Cercospora berteroae]|uniref:Uncharacterized protein n=1 Tax=Cercospora berteroae TaxID=357750 RepID=A0A2S6C6W1_9PEZI|nr:hypothetical protein CBER1_02742 [Cercospora berteroae]